MGVLVEKPVEAEGVDELVRGTARNVQADCNVGYPHRLLGFGKQLEDAQAAVQRRDLPHGVILGLGTPRSAIGGGPDG